MPRHRVPEHQCPSACKRAPVRRGRPGPAPAAGRRAGARGPPRSASTRGRSSTRTSWKPRCAATSLSARCDSGPSPVTDACAARRPRARSPRSSCRGRASRGGARRWRAAPPPGSRRAPRPGGPARRAAPRGTRAPRSTDARPAGRRAGRARRTTPAAARARARSRGRPAGSAARGRAGRSARRRARTPATGAARAGARGDRSPPGTAERPTGRPGHRGASRVRPLARAQVPDPSTQGDEVMEHRPVRLSPWLHATTRTRTSFHRICVVERVDLRPILGS